MIFHKQLRKYVIRPVLEHMGIPSRSAEEMLVFTAAAESMGGEYLHQLRNGPAVGIYQIEPRTHDDIWENFLKYRPRWRNAILDFDLPALYGTGKNGAMEMAGNLYYATAMARCYYLRIPHPLPDYNDLEGLAKEWKNSYNTHLGAGTWQGALEKYRKYVQ